MNANCNHCGRSGSSLHELDQPEGMLLCNDCYEYFVWTCDLCHARVASPDIEGGDGWFYGDFGFEKACMDCWDVIESRADCIKLNRQFLCELEVQATETWCRLKESRFEIADEIEMLNAELLLADGLECSASVGNGQIGRLG